MYWQVWEALRASTAAPLYFKDMVLQRLPDEQAGGGEEKEEDDEADDEQEETEKEQFRLKL